MTDTAAPPTTAPLVFLDTETDGLRPDCRVWEIAMIRREPDYADTQLDSRLQIFVSIRTDQAEKGALDLGGYYERHPEGRDLAWKPRFTAGTRQLADVADLERPRRFHDRPGPVAVSERRAAEAVAQMTAGAYVVGVNPAFDMDRLDRMLRRHGYTPRWHHYPVDVVGMAAAQLRLAPPWKSDDLAARLGVDPPAEEDRHTAMGDARWVARIYDTVMAAGARPAREESTR